MFRILPSVALAMALTLGTAQAAPSVSRGLVESLPTEVFSQTETIEAEVEQLDSAYDVKREELDRAKGNKKALKLEIKAAKAQVKADKAERKAARKRGDDAAASAARDAIAASEARVAELEAQYDATTALVGLLDAQADQIKRQMQLKEAILQVVLAQAVNEHVEPLDDSKFRGARAKAELKFQQARADVEVARSRYSSSGGTVMPDPMIIPEDASTPEMGGPSLTEPIE